MPYPEGAIASIADVNKQSVRYAYLLLSPVLENIIKIINVERMLNYNHFLPSSTRNSP